MEANVYDSSSSQSYTYPIHSNHPNHAQSSSASVTTAYTTATSVSTGESTIQRRPNILFILADQVAAPLLRIHDAASKIKTPHIDALASKSTIFTSAYCPSPLCAPSRSSLVTGQLPTKIAAWDNAAPLGVEIPTYAHYLRREGYETVLAGKMHFVGEQLHGYEERLTSDIYPGDFGWSVNWDEPDRRLEWYHNSSSILQAGPCVRSNQLDYDEEVMFKSTRYLYQTARRPQTEGRRPFCLTVSLTHPHDPYTIHQEYWDRYEDSDIPLPRPHPLQGGEDPHSRRLRHVCDLEQDIPEEAVKRARRAYYGAVSYVDDNVGKLLRVLKECGMDDNTIVVFSADHGDMLGERGLWYKMSWFEGSARVPLIVYDPRRPLDSSRRIDRNVSTLDILPTLVDLVGGRLETNLPLDGRSLLPHLRTQISNPTPFEIAGEDKKDDTVFGEYTGEGTIAPLMMIRRGPWKFITCITDPPQLFHLPSDPHELTNLMVSLDTSIGEISVRSIAEAFVKEAGDKWDMNSITQSVLTSQRSRRLCWDALKQGRFEHWDYEPNERARESYIRSHIPLDELELRARFPPVDAFGRTLPRGKALGQAGSINQ